MAAAGLLPSLLAALLLTGLSGAACQLPDAPDISPQECADHELPSTLWIGTAGIDGMEGIAMPGYHYGLEIGYNGMSVTKWVLGNLQKKDGVFARSSVTVLQPSQTTTEFGRKSTGDDPRLALAHATEIVTNPEAEDRLLGIFGGVSSEESRAVQLVASTFGYSQISSVSESRELSDKTRYPTFNRAIAPSYRTASVIVSLCQHFGWDYVGVINGDTLEDFEAVRVFKNEAQDANITVAAVVNAASDSPEDMRELVNHMHTELEHVRIWVQFYPTDSVELARFFSYAVGTPLLRPENMFIAGGRMASFVYTMHEWLSTNAAPPEWKLNEDASIEDTFSAMAGCISVTTSLGWGTQVYEDFVNEINEVGLAKFINPFYIPGLTDEVAAIFATKDKLNYDDMRHSHAGLTVDAFDSFVRAASAMVDDGLACRVTGPNRNHTLYLEYLRALDFDGLSGRVRYDEVGDRISNYLIHSIQFNTSATGIERMRSLNPEVVMVWEPTAGGSDAAAGPDRQQGRQQGLNILPGKHFQWRDGSSSATVPPPEARPPQPPPRPEAAPAPVPAGSTTGLTIALATGCALGLLLLGVGLLVLRNLAAKRAHGHTGQIRAGVLDATLLDINSVPVYSDDMSTEMDGSFMYRDVTIHVLNAHTCGLPERSVLIKCKHPLANCPPNQLVAINAMPGLPHCVQHAAAATIAAAGHKGSFSPTPGSRVPLPPVQLESLDPELSLRGRAQRLPRVSSNSQVVDLPGGVSQAVGDVEDQKSFSALIKPKLSTAPSRKRRTANGTAMANEFAAGLKDQVVRLMKLRSARLQPVLGMTFISEAPAMISEKLQGNGNLHDTVHGSATPLDVDVKVQLLLDIAQGLSTLHQQEPRILHPGMSMYNIMLDESGFRAILTQYGYNPVHGARFGGLLQYAAPEVLAGGEPSPASDIYAWAMLAIELISRKQLYEGVDASSVLTGVRDGKLRPEFSEEDQEEFGNIADLILECSAKNPMRRPSLDEVLMRLREFQEGLKAQAVAPSAKTEELLRSIFPAEVAKQLAEGKRVEPQHHNEVTIFFSDIVGFTNLSSVLRPDEVMEMLNRLYLTLDRLTAKHGLFKVETIGDAYMSVGNLHPKVENHAARVARFAMDALRESAKIPVHHNKPELGFIKMRAGFHTGPVVSSVVGTLNPRYCLFGDTVNTASRMESTSVAGKIHCSDTAYQSLKAHAPEIQCERRTDLGEIKGKGKMKTYFVHMEQVYEQDGVYELSAP